MAIENKTNSNYSFFNFNAQSEELKKSKIEFIHLFNTYPENIDFKYIKNLEKIKPSRFKINVLRVILFVKNFLNQDTVNIHRLLNSHKEIKKIIKLYNKSESLKSRNFNRALPFVFIADKLDEVASQYRFKALEAASYSESLVDLQDHFSKGSLSTMEMIDTTRSETIQLLLENIADMYSDKQTKKKGKLRKNFQELMERVSKITNAQGQNAIQQLDELYLQKRNYYLEIVKLYTIKQKFENNYKIEDIKKDIKSLDKSTLILLNIDLTNLDRKESIDTNNVILKAIELIEQNSIKKINVVINDVLDKVNDNLSVYEVSANRLIEEFSPEILKKPINVTMIGVEYTGFVKEGGLAEALEGLTKAMRSQHPDNKVRLIFPKFSILPKAIQEKIDLVQPKEYMSNGKPYKVYIIEIDGVEYDFIEHPLFILKGEKPSIYGPDGNAVKARFAAFSGLAADFVKEVKTDIIHLHDWHVAGVALKLHKDHLKYKEKKEVPPIVFTYHNNSRAAQGRFEQGIYNYEPVIQGLIEAGIASENINAFVETMKKADAVTTVSETFGIESQDMRRGEGVSFAAREAAESGKLTGIINGSNPHSWNPEKDFSLKNWKDESGKVVDLTYGLANSNEEIIAKKEQCKTQLQSWITQNFPEAKMDLTKPIVTYVGRLDSYQKGLDKLENAIQETIKNGGQFIVMGSLEDKDATHILDRLQSKYKENVLFIRDYKDPNGRYHFQQGNENKQGCGSLIRAASDFLFMPSRFEPCGLVQFEGWLFGSFAIGSNVGGLADTIIPPVKDPENFNGFLFNRDSQKKDSMGHVIKEALITWNKFTDEQKGNKIRRLIEDGKKYSWSTSPSGYSPVEKYRFAYENAKKFAAARNTGPSLGTVNLKAGINKIRDSALVQHHKASHYDKLEEKYNTYFYKKNVKFKKLEKMYKSLPESLRMQVPLPYGRKVKANTYEELGAHISPEGIQFTVEASHAKQVEVKIFTDQETKTYELTKLDTGNWAGFIPGLEAGVKYQYLIDKKPKLDPLGLSQVDNLIPGQPPCSVAIERDYKWQDQEWMTSRVEQAGKPSAVSIYEMHPLFWKKKKGIHLNYREIATELVKHCKEVGYTHVELMGILEHPDERSWGYQVTGFFAPNSRMGSPEDFKYLVETLHKNKIGVYLDWIPAHFATDKYALSNFDGSSQYQPSKTAVLFSLRNYAFRWGTYFFDFKKKAVRNFLTSSANYWLKEMHIDGLRVDAVRCILLSENPKSSCRFLQDLNAVVHKEFPGVTMMAEDYSGASNVTKSMSIGGLGFDQKWNIGWMKHSLEYFGQNPKERRESYEKIISAIGGDTFHKMILAISHDEVTEKLKTLIEKTPNFTTEEKFANLRSFFGFIMSVPGKKLMFMGSEFGMSEAWTDFIGKEKGIAELENITEEGKKVMLSVQHLNQIYKTYKPFWQHDDNANDLTWIEKNDPQKIIHAYRRTSDDGESVACLHNFSDKNKKEFTVMFENKEVLKKFKNMAIEWKKDNRKIKNKQLTDSDLTRLSYLSRYPDIAKKIESNQKLREEFFEWILKNQKSAKEFLEKQGWYNLNMNPQEIFNSDDKQFGGQGRINHTLELIKDEAGTILGYNVKIPPLSSVFISENATAISIVT